MRSCCVFDSPRLSLPLLAVYLLSASSSTMWWTNTLRTPANEDLGTFAEYDPLTKPLAHRLGACTRSPSSTAHMAVTTFSHSPGQGDWPYVFHMVRSMGSRIERADPRQSLGFFGLVSLHRTSALTTLNICSQPQSRRGRLSRFFFCRDCCVLCHAPSHLHSDWFAVRWLGSLDALLSFDAISPYSGCQLQFPPMVVTLPAALRQQITNHVASSAREL